MLPDALTAVPCPPVRVDRVDPSPADFLDVRQARTSDDRWAQCGLARELSELARQLSCAADVGTVASLVVDAVVRNIDGGVAAAVVLSAGGSAFCAAHSDDTARRLTTAQLVTHPGPGLDCADTHRTIRSDDLRTDRRWPAYADCAAGLGVRSVLSLELFVEDRTLGFLEVIGKRPAAFDRPAESTGLLIASHAAIALDHASTAPQRRRSSPTVERLHRTMAVWAHAGPGNAGTAGG